MSLKMQENSTVYNLKSDKLFNISINSALKLPATLRQHASYVLERISLNRLFVRKILPLPQYAF